ncbi:MAG TPA: hypothetical protein VGH73_12465 [Thermoanaerobaculia bacterium]|jgi:hypothetical protein
MKNLIQVSQFHETAMAFAEQALLSPDPRQAGKLFRSAFEHERKAAELLEGAYDYEPTRSVLYRSAATLARDCRDFSEAKRLIQEGLTGHPPGDIAAELKELLRLVRSDEARGPRQEVPDEA